MTGRPSAAVEQVRADLGDPTALVTAPGRERIGEQQDMPVESWRRMIDVNLSGTLYCLKAAIPAMDGTGTDAPFFSAPTSR